MQKKVLLFLCIFICTFSLYSAASTGFFVGYSEKELPVDLSGSVHYVAGYKQNNVATGILDCQYVKALYIEDCSNNYLVLIVVDCIALARCETLAIRAELEKIGVDNVHIISTHDHAGSDTLGLWGPEGRDGKNASFMDLLRSTAVATVQEAVRTKCHGQLFFGYVDTLASGIQEDTRAPYIYDSNLYSFRFVPDDEKKNQIRILNYATHAESLDGDNQLISADFPAVVAQTLLEKDGSKTIWIPGAIGGLIRTRFVESDGLENCKVTGKTIADFALKIQNEVELDSLLSLQTVQLSIPCENPLFVAMRALGVLNSVSHSNIFGKLFIDTEVSLVQLGQKKILMIPGEIFPELIYDSFPSYLSDDVLVFGLCDDEIGYIIPKENFLLNSEHPYLEKVVDVTGENHYEETNSLGPEAAACIQKAIEKLYIALK